MQRLPKLLSAKTLTALSVDQYSPAANTLATISAATATNKTALPHTITVTVTIPGPSVLNVCYQKSIAPGDSFVVYGLIGQTLGPGEPVSALADAGASIDLVISGYETKP